MIKLTIEQLINSTGVLQKLSASPLKARTAFAVAKLLKTAEAEMNGFNDARMILVKKYGQKDEKGEIKLDENNNYLIESEHIADFNRELSELIGTEIELNVTKIKLDDLTLDITPSEMIALEPFLEIE